MQAVAESELVKEDPKVGGLEFAGGRLRPIQFRRVLIPTAQYEPRLYVESARERKGTYHVSL